MAMALRFAVEWTLASAAFWVTRVSAINQLYFVVFLFLSGYGVPLALLPGPVRILAEWLPFYRMLGFPVELLLGRLSMNQVVFGFAAQIGWLVVAVTLLNVMWRAACVSTRRSGRETMTYCACSGSIFALASCTSCSTGPT